jgi:hypothetical protein
VKDEERRRRRIFGGRTDDDESRSGGGRKLRAQRAGEPTFEIIVEVTCGKHDEWRIVMDSAAAVDAILDGQKFPVERRMRAASGETLRLAHGRG